MLENYQVLIDTGLLENYQVLIDPGLAIARKFKKDRRNLAGQSINPRMRIADAERIARKNLFKRVTSERFLDRIGLYNSIETTKEEEKLANNLVDCFNTVFHKPYGDWLKTKKDEYFKGMANYQESKLIIVQLKKDNKSIPTQLIKEIKGGGGP